MKKKFFKLPPRAPAWRLRLPPGVKPRTERARFPAGAGKRRSFYYGTDRSAMPQAFAGSSPILRVTLLIVGLLAVATLLADMFGLVRRSDLLTPRTAGRPGETVHYRDPQGRFAFAFPGAWELVTGRAALPFDVMAAGPQGQKIQVEVTAVDYDNFNRLLARIQRIERDNGVNTHIVTTNFHGRPATQRSVRLVRERLYAVDFLANGQAHHILLSAPREQYDATLPGLLAILESYEFLPAKNSSSSAARMGKAGE